GQVDDDDGALAEELGPDARRHEARGEGPRVDGEPRPAPEPAAVVLEDLRVEPEHPELGDAVLDLPCGDEPEDGRQADEQYDGGGDDDRECSHAAGPRTLGGGCDRAVRLSGDSMGVTASALCRSLAAAG